MSDGHGSCDRLVPGPWPAQQMGSVLACELPILFLPRVCLPGPRHCSSVGASVAPRSFTRYPRLPSSPPLPHCRAARWTLLITTPSWPIWAPSLMPTCTSSRSPCKCPRSFRPGSFKAAVGGSAMLAGAGKKGCLHGNQTGTLARPCSGTHMSPLWHVVAAACSAIGESILYKTCNRRQCSVYAGPSASPTACPRIVM